MKKITSLLIAIVVMAFFVTPVFADMTTQNARWITEAERFILDAVYANGEYNIARASSLSVGSQIPAYVVDVNTTEDMTESGVRYYPILSNNELIGLLGVYESDGRFVFSYTEGCIGSIIEALTVSETIAFVWVNNVLRVLTPCDSAAYDDLMAYSTFLLEFENPYACCIPLFKNASGASRYYPNSYSLSVTNKPQGAYGLCWAACTACVGEFHTGISYSALDIWLAFNCPVTGTEATVQTALSSIYQYYSYFPGSSPNYANICNTIYNSNKPIIAGLAIPGNTIGHMIVIYGYASGTYYSAISVMDPASGMTTLSISNVSVPMMIVLNGNTWYIYSYLY